MPRSFTPHDDVHRLITRSISILVAMEGITTKYETQSFTSYSSSTDPLLHMSSRTRSSLLAESYPAFLIASPNSGVLIYTSFPDVSSTQSERLIYELSLGPIP